MGLKNAKYFSLLAGFGERGVAAKYVTITQQNDL